MSINFIMFGGHPDDFGFCGGGTGLKFMKLGGKAKYVAATIGDIGNPTKSGGEYARYRQKCVDTAIEDFGIEYEVWPEHDAEFFYTLETRYRAIRAIREFKADIVVCPRRWDLHPDRHAMGMLAMDAAYFSTIPNVLPLSPALERPPIVLNMWDPTKKPIPFVADIAVDVEDIWEDLLHMADIHDTMMYEWEPFLQGIADKVNAMTKEEKFQWLREFLGKRQIDITNEHRDAVIKRYGQEKGSKIKFAEVFEISEYGRIPSSEEIKEIFQF